MIELSTVFRAGTRNSPLALWQTSQVLDRLGALFPDAQFDVQEVTTPGDTDRTTDLRESPLDFFTRTLDEAVLNREVDFAVHSAKDLPASVADGLDWFWLPDSGDRRDCLIGSLEPKTIGVSSDRRAAYATDRFPNAKQLPIRGTIEERIAQVDDGTFDLIIIAGVALQRLGLEERITEWISLEALDTPEAQGALAITFRKNDPRMVAIRNLFVKSATFVGAGVTEGHCTLDGIRALQTAEICLYDALMDDSLLKHLSEGAQKVFVGKRQDEVNQLLCDCVRKGKRTVRLKASDDGIFGEEVDALEDFSLASRVIPGISAMQTAADGTGIDNSLGALGGKRILLTCSEALMPQAVQSVHDFGGRPVVWPLIELVLNVDAPFSSRCVGSECGKGSAATLEDYDWVCLTSPSSVRCFHELLLKEKIDCRSLPKIMTVGSGSFRALEKIGLGCDLMPESDFSGKGLLEVAAPIVSGQKILRLRSQKAGSGLADGLRAAGAEVEDCILYENRVIEYDRCPEFDSVFFASASAVESFVSQWGADVLQDKLILAIGGPTQKALADAGLEADVVGAMATVDKSLNSLAVYAVTRRIEDVS